MTEKVTKVTSEKEVSFSKQDLLKAQMFQHTKDAVNVVLEDGKHYTKSEVEAMLLAFYKGGK